MPSLEIRMVERRRGADPGQLLDGDGLGDAVGAGAPVGLRNAERRQLHLLAGLERLPRELGVAVGLGGVRRHLLLAEGAHGLAEVPLDVGQGEGRRAHSAILAHTAILAGAERYRFARPASLQWARRCRTRRPDSSTGAISGIQCDTLSRTSKV